MGHLSAGFDPAKISNPSFLAKGPQSTVSQFWSYRWNFQLITANGYIIVLLTAAVCPVLVRNGSNKSVATEVRTWRIIFRLSMHCHKESYVNKDKLGCVGASYGGFSVYWLAGSSRKTLQNFPFARWNVSICLSNTSKRRNGSSTGIWVALTGTKNNAIAQRSCQLTVYLLINGIRRFLWFTVKKDYPYPRFAGMATLNAAVLRGVPAQMLIFPWRKPLGTSTSKQNTGNGLLLRWLDKWLK